MKSPHTFQGVLSDTIWSFLLKSFSAVLALGIGLMLARLLGAEGYGAYANAWAWVAILAIPGTLGFPTLVVRETALYREAASWGRLRGLRRFTQTVSFSTAVSLALLAAILAWVVYPDPSAALMLLSLWLAISSLPLVGALALQQAFLRGLRKVIHSQLGDHLVRPAVMAVALGVVFLVPHFELSAPGAVVLRLVATTVALVLASMFLRAYWPDEVKYARPKSKRRAWLRSALPLLAIAGTQSINAQADIVMLGVMAEREAVGAYAVAVQLSSLIVFVLISANTALGPSIAALHAARMPQSIAALVSKIARRVFGASAIIWLVLLIFGIDILAIYGEAFVVAYDSMVILSTGLLICTLASAVGILLTMTGYEKHAAASNAAAALLNVFLNVMWIPRFGIEGAAWATAISTIILNLSLGIVVYRKLNINATVFGRVTTGNA